MLIAIFAKQGPLGGVCKITPRFSADFGSNVASVARTSEVTVFCKHLMVLKEPLLLIIWFHRFSTKASAEQLDTAANIVSAVVEVDTFLGTAAPDS